MKVSKVEKRSSALESQFEVEELSPEELPAPSQEFAEVVRETKGFSFAKEMSVDELEESAKETYTSEAD